MNFLLNIFSDTKVTELKGHSWEPCRGCGKQRDHQHVNHRFTVEIGTKSATVIACSRKCAIKAAGNLT